MTPPTTDTSFSVYLGRIGVEVICAENGAEALNYTAKSEFDLVLMDFEMPGRNGAEVLRSLRNNGYRGRVVAMTGHNRDHQALFDFDDVIVKPLSRNALYKLVNVDAPPKSRETSPSIST